MIRLQFNLRLCLRSQNVLNQPNQCLFQFLGPWPGDWSTWNLQSILWIIYLCRFLRLVKLQLLFLSALCSYQLLVLITKLCHFWSFQNFPNFQTNPEWVGFAPKTPSNNLWTNSYCSPLVRPKNIPVKTLSLLVFPKHPKLPKLSN